MIVPCRVHCAVFLLALAGFLGCTGTVDPIGNAARTGVAVDVQPQAVQVLPGESISFAAIVTGSASTSVTWSMQEASDCGSVSQSGVYTAPQSLGVCHVVATSVADGSQQDIAVVTVTTSPTPVAVSISPTSIATNSCQSVTFTATVTGSSNKVVTWSVQEGSSGGTVSIDGIYTAPPVAGTYHVVANSQADSTKSSVAAITVTDKILSVTVNPRQANIPRGGSVQLTAIVTTTCGTLIESKTITN